LIGLVPFLAMNIGVVKRLIEAYKASIRDSDQWLVWALSAAFFGLLLGMNSFCLDGQPITIYYMMIGFAAAMPNIAGVMSRQTMYKRVETLYGAREVMHQQDGASSKFASKPN